jgi:hypothetical protein
MRDYRVTLQITLAPSDYAHARHLLRHQVETWRKQVDEILLTIDFHKSSGRFSDRWAEGENKIRPLAESVADARVVDVDYTSAAKQRVSDTFFAGRPIPLKDFRGGPYYSYFFALAEARHKYVLHADSDMFFGGRSQTWVHEAVSYMQSHPEVLLTAPLSGPPRVDGRMLYLQAQPDQAEPHAFQFDVMTSRLFMLDRDRFRSSIGALTPTPPPAVKNLLIALLEGNPAADLPEHLFTKEMRRKGLVRREFLGATPGMWSLHPPYRCPDFYAKLPELVRRVEAGEIPEAQCGDHDLNDSLVDWSGPRAALAQNRLWRRLFHRYGATVRRLVSVRPPSDTSNSS